MVMYQASPSFHTAGSRQPIALMPSGGAANTGFSGILIHFVRLGSFGSAAMATIWRSGHLAIAAVASEETADGVCRSRACVAWEPGLAASKTMRAHPQWRTLPP